MPHSLGDVLTMLASIGDKTLLAGLTLAAFSAVIGAASFALKLLVDLIREGIEDRRLFRTAIVRFYNDALIRQRDFKIVYGDDAFMAMARQIAASPDDFKFSSPSADLSDNTEIMKYLHRLAPDEARLARTYIVYGELLASFQKVMSSELATFDKRRKMNALAKYREIARLVSYLGDELIATLERKRILQREKARFDAIFEKMKAISADTGSFAHTAAALIDAQAAAPADSHSSGGRGPDMVDLQDFVKLAHKIANAYRRFKPSD